MKLLIIISLLGLCAFTVNGRVSDDLNLRLRLTTGEHSKDSSSETTTLTIAPGASVIGWTKTFGGRRGRTTEPEHKDFKLSDSDRAAVLKLIREGDLLVAKSIELPEAASGYSYFSIALDLTLDQKNGAISISGPRTATAVKAEIVFQKTMALVREVYRIINSQDKTIRFAEMVK